MGGGRVARRRRRRRRKRRRRRRRRGSRHSSHIPLTNDSGHICNAAHAPLSGLMTATHKETKIRRIYRNVFVYG